MDTPNGLLKVIAKAALNAVGGGVAGEILVEVLPDIAKDVWAWWSKDRDEAGRKADLEALAQTPTATLRKEAEQVVAEVAPDRSAAERGRVAGYLSLLPSVIRQSLRRPEDPSGKSVPSALSLRRPEDLIPFLPPRVPRFKPGDHPLPGVDLVLVKMLGAGGFGEVWEARNPHLPGNDPVALKFCLDPTAARALHNEVAILARVLKQGRHPGIVPLLRTYLNADPPCLEYEFVSGGDLVSGVHTALQKGPLTPDTAARVVLNLARTMGFAHRLSPPIVHRDLKPANILLRPRPDGRSSDLLIADFGIGGIAARQALDAENRLSGLASMSILVGSHTPLYASPQQRQGAAPDPRDDVHALGVIWYQLLIGDLTKEAAGPLAEGEDLAADLLLPEPAGVRREGKVRVGLSGPVGVFTGAGVPARMFGHGATSAAEGSGGVAPGGLRPSGATLLPVVTQRGRLAESALDSDAKACRLSRKSDSERCRSGRSGRSRKPVWQKCYRGFESLPLRFIRQSLSNSFGEADLRSRI